MDQQFNNFTKANYLSLKARFERFLADEKAMNTDPALIRMTVVDHFVKHMQTKEGNHQCDGLSMKEAAGCVVLEMMMAYVPEEDHRNFFANLLMGIAVSRTLVSVMCNDNMQLAEWAKRRAIGMME